MDAEPYGIYNNFFVTNVSFWLRPDVQHFLRYVNRSNTIYTKRYNDILWQSTALKLFMEPARLHMFQDFAYEHVTVRFVTHQNSYGKGGQYRSNCTLIGGIALPVDIESGMVRNIATARDRLNALLNNERCLFAVREFMNRQVQPCVQTTRQQEILSFVVGPVPSGISTEQPFCNRWPAPYFCNAGPHSHHTKAHNAHVCANTITGCAALPREMHGKKHTLDICPATHHLPCAASRYADGTVRWGCAGARARANTTANAKRRKPDSAAPG